MANVVVSLRYPDVKARVACNTELLTCDRLHPSVGSCQLVLAATSRAFHDFRRAGVESQRWRQHHADRFFSAIGKCDAVAHAFAFKVNTGGGGDGDVLEVWSNCRHDQNEFSNKKGAVLQCTTPDFKAL